MTAPKTTEGRASARSRTTAKAKGGATARTTRKRQPGAVVEQAVSLRELGGRLVSVFGPSDSRALVELPIGVAAQLFVEPFENCGRTNVADAVGRDLEEIKKRAPALAGSALASTALALALQLDHPYNSATSKSMCAKALMEALEQLRELAPPLREKDKVDDLAAKRAARRSHLGSGGAGAASSPGS